MSPPDLLLAISPSLSQQLRSQTNQNLAKLIRANYNTQFAQIASELTEFRDAMTCDPDAIEDDTISHIFRDTVQFTAYDAYAPLLARLHEKPCRESAVVNLLAPGLPDYLVRSSSTSGGARKLSLKYGRLSEPSATPSVTPKRTTAYLFYFRCNPLDVTDEDGHLVKKVYLSSATGVIQRGSLGLHPDRDEEIMAAFISDYAAPFAAGFVRIWRSLLLIQALFAINERSLESIRMAFINSFVDMMRHLDTEFDVTVECIANGTIPDLDGVAEVRHYLEPNIAPNPERAAELRTLGPPSSRPGWCSQVWPNLRSISGIASGSFVSSIPLAQWFLGPNVDVLPYCYGSSEGLIGWPYSPHELNQFKTNSEVIIEFLDISKGDSIGSIIQPVKRGVRYEVVLTTPDGLWRYRLGDIVDIAGFDPRDGVPVIQFIERASAVIRFPHFMISEEELRAAILSAAGDTLGNIVDWTTTIDERKPPSTVGFFIELAADQVVDSALTTQRMLDVLMQLNETILWSFEQGMFRKPTIWIVESGTFSEFRQLKIEEGKDTYSLGQVKIPVVLPKAAYVAWFSNRIAKEL